MRILPRADIVGAALAVGILVAGAPTSAFAQERGPSASATVRAAVTILDPVVVDAPSALRVGFDDQGNLSAHGAPTTRSRAPISVHTSVERITADAPEPLRPGSTSRPTTAPAGTLRVTYVVSVIS